MGEKLEIPFQASIVDDILILFTVVLLPENYVIPDRIIHDPGLLGHQTHASVDSDLGLVLVGGEFHLPQQRIQQRWLSTSNAPNNGHHFPFFYPEVQILQVIAVVRDDSFDLFCIFVPIEVPILHNYCIFIFANLIPAMVNARQVDFFSQ